MKTQHETRRSDDRKALPFFARFLEGENSLRVKTDLKGGGPTKPSIDINHTMKYPSDGDEI